MVIKENKIPETTETLLLGKPMSTNIGLLDGQVLVYNRAHRQWEPGPKPIADGTYVMGLKLTGGGTDGTITVENGIIKSIVQAT